MRRWFSLLSFVAILVMGTRYHRFFCGPTKELKISFPSELTKKGDGEEGGPQPEISRGTPPDRGYIRNERQQAINLRTINKNGRLMNLYYLYPGQTLRITRLFNTIKELNVNGKVLEDCRVSGIETKVPLTERSGETILIKDDEGYFPYLECIDQTTIE